MSKKLPAICGHSIAYTLSIVGGKWNWIIIALLFQYDILRYGQIKTSLPRITHKMLSQQLKALEANELIHRKEYPQIPPKVEYSLTEKGRSLMPVLTQMMKWGEATMPPIEADTLTTSFYNEIKLPE
jgi:DNA-binding HxlR family transcriptional regulator